MHLVRMFTDHRGVSSQSHPFPDRSSPVIIHTLVCHPFFLHPFPSPVLFGATCKGAPVGPLVFCLIGGQAGLREVSSLELKCRCYDHLRHEYPVTNRLYPFRPKNTENTIIRSHRNRTILGKIPNTRNEHPRVGCQRLAQLLFLLCSLSKAAQYTPADSPVTATPKPAAPKKAGLNCPR